MTMKVIFAGTPQFSVPILQTLIDANMDVVAAFTQPDRPSGRGRKLTASPVKALATEHNIPVYQPETLKSSGAALWTDIECDIAIVVAYGLILPQTVLDSPRLGCVNVHASLLPRWRGAAPINRAIEAGDSETGVTLMQMDAGLDTGDILAAQRVPIRSETSATDLHDALSATGASLLASHLKSIEAGSLQAQKQDNSRATYARKLSRDESPLDWTLDANILSQKVRALVPWPCTTGRHGEVTLKFHDAQVGAVDTDAAPGTIVEVTPDVLRVACGSGTLDVRCLQKPGSRALPVREFTNGYEIAAGERFELTDTRE